MTRQKLTVHDRVLLALARAARNTQIPVPYEDIVLESWKCFPERFSLRKHPEFPDSNDQNKSLYGPLKKDGYVVSLGDMVFRLTDAGIDRAATLEGLLNGRQASSSGARLSRDHERALRTAKASEAYVKWIDGRADEIVDFDARAFFGITVTTRDENRRIRVQRMCDAISVFGAARLPAAERLQSLATFLIEQFPTVVGSDTNSGR